MDALTHRKPTRDERGWVLVVAMVVMFLMLGIGLAALALSDTQTKQSRQERERESSLNLAEGALYAQSFILALPPTSNVGPDQGWPGSSAKVYATCTQGSGGIQCPNDSSLANVAGSANAPASFQNVDTASGTTWTTTILDDACQSGTGGAGQPACAPDTNFQTAQTTVHYDANQDSKVWVKSTALVRGHQRTVVGLMQIENLPLPFPRTAITAGSFSLQQNGNQTYVDTGSTGVQLRCSPVTNPDGTPNKTCANYDPSKPGEVNGSIAGGGDPSTVLTAQQLLDLKSKALDFGTYFPAGTCPSGDDMQKPVVYVENCSHTYGSNEVGNQYQCSYSIRNYTPVNNERCIHGPNATPFGGQVVWARGVLGFGSGVAFFGVIYNLNLDNCGLPKSDDVADAISPCQYDSGTNQSFLVSTQAGGTIVGSVNVDGAGGVAIGSNASNIVYDPSVFKDATVFGTTGLVQNTWQELIPG